MLAYDEGYDEIEDDTDPELDEAQEAIGYAMWSIEVITALYSGFNTDIIMQACDERKIPLTVFALSSAVN